MIIVMSSVYLSIRGLFFYFCLREVPGFSLRCMRDTMTANRGLPLTTSNLIGKTHIVKKISVGC